MTTYELKIKGPFGPMHKTVNGYIWSGLDDLTSSTIFIDGPCYKFYHRSLLECLAKNELLKYDIVKIINNHGLEISNNHGIPKPNVQIEFIERHSRKLPMIYTLVHEGKVVQPLVIDESALEIIKLIFPLVKYEISPMYIAGRMF